MLMRWMPPSDGHELLLESRRVQRGETFEAPDGFAHEWAKKVTPAKAVEEAPEKPARKKGHN